TVVVVKWVNTARANAALAAVQGYWEGELNVRQTRLRLVLNVFKTNDSYRATIDSIDQNAIAIPVSHFTASKDSVLAELPALNAKFEATLNPDRTEMAGRWTQLKSSFPLTLKRTTEPTRIAEPLAANEFAPRADSDLQGAWQGTLKIGAIDLRLNLRLA